MARTQVPPILVTDVVLNERYRNVTNLPERADVVFDGTLKINGRQLPLELRLFRLDKEGWQIGKWYVSIDINKPTRSRFVSSSNVPDSAETCGMCHKESRTAKAVAKVIGAKLKGAGFELAPGVGHRTGKGSVTKPFWWLFDLYADRQGPIKYGQSRRLYYHTESRKITCPVHGVFVQEKQELSL